MTTAPQANPVDAVDKAFKEAIAYYEGPGSKSKAKIGAWGPKETLSHFIYWVNKGAQGMESVAKGGDPVPMFDTPMTTDELNAREVAKYSSKSMSQVGADARKAYGRMVKAARALPNLDVPIVISPTGERPTARQRLERTAIHTLNHLKELKSAG